MSDKDIELQESLKRIQEAMEFFVAMSTIARMHSVHLSNVIFALQAHPYHLGAICQHMTDKGIAYANNTFICLN